MDIQTAILGFLAREPRSGYDLKREFQDDLYLHWSGNNNQIYKALMRLHREGLVDMRVETPDRGPAKKLYSVTHEGRAALHAELQREPTMPQIRHPFLASLAFSESLTDAELTGILDRYRAAVETEATMWSERLRRFVAATNEGRSGRTARLIRAIHERWIDYYEREAEYVAGIANALANMDSEAPDEG